MNLSQYVSYDALGLAEAIRQGKTSAEEARSLALAAIEKLNPQLNAVLQVLEKESANDVAAARNGPFAGVPFLVKELICQPAGVPYRMGSRLTGEGLSHDYDTELMKRFRDAGLITVGTTQTPEFGYNPTTETTRFGSVQNPWKRGFTPGGSSGGSGAAVAAGIVPIAHANDGGGSIRIPAACCGLVGLKPSRDRIPTGPDYSDPLFGWACEFVVSRSVRDSAALLDCVSGPDPGAPGFLPAPDSSFASAVTEKPGSMRIAWTFEPVSSSVHPECRAAVEKTVETLASLGHEIVEASPSYSWERFIETVHIPWVVLNSAMIEELEQTTGQKASLENLEAVTYAVYEEGKRFSALDLHHALEFHASVTRSFGRFFEDYDLLVTPSLSRPPNPHGEINQDDPSLSARDWTEKLFDYVTYTPQFNSTGQPAISLPLHMSSDGLPVGVQVGTKMGGEATLLRVAAQLEEAMPWRDRKPGYLFAAD